MVQPQVQIPVRANLARVEENIAAACARVGRPASEVRLVAVTKSVDPPIIQELQAAGLRDFGENRVQQLIARAEILGSAPGGWTPAGDGSPLPCWHMIGHLQRNKVARLLPHVRIVHSVDSTRLAAELGAAAAARGWRVDVLLETNVAGEASKTGVAPDELEGLVAAIRGWPALTLRGLMTMAPLVEDAERARPCFARLRELLRGLQARGAVGPECVHLSMGMSQDYAVAVEEGATVVRVGSALFTPG